VNALLILPTVLTFALVDAPRSASLLQEPAPAVAPAAPAVHEATPIVVHEATPIVEATAPAATPGAEQPTEAAGATPPSAAALAASPPPRKTVQDVNPGRVWLGGVVGGLGVITGLMAGAAVGYSVPIATSSLGWDRLFNILIGMVVGGWVVGPLAASVAMGGHRVPLRVLGYACAGLLLGILSVAVPVVGAITFLAGPTIGAVYAVATSPVDAAGEPVSLRSSAAGPLLSFTF
jgi:hypothetical protein